MNKRLAPSAAARLRLIGATTIFGTVGLLRRAIPLSSGMIAFVRGFIGVIFLLLLSLLRRRPISRSAIRANALRLILSGAMIGFNWILLFEAYQYTSVAVATLCYYAAPIFVILASPLLLQEKLGGQKLLCAAAAVLGMVLISGVGSSTGEGNGLRGILLALGAALLYATVILLNKKMGEISAEDRTIIQLFTAAAVLLPYILLTEDLSALHPDSTAIILLLIAGIIHTGLAYSLYFGSIRDLSAQTVALFSYIDPIVAVILSAVVLKEPFTLLNLLGAVLVLGSTCISELLPQGSKAAG